MTLLRRTDPALLEGGRGPFASGSPLLAYQEFLREHDDDATMWRMIVPGQTGRGIAMARVCLEHYEEFEGTGLLSQDEMVPDDDQGPFEGSGFVKGEVKRFPLYVPAVVDWFAVTKQEGLQMGLDDWYDEQYRNPSWESAADALPVVGIKAINLPWEAITLCYSLWRPDDEPCFDSHELSSSMTIPTLPVQSVMPTEDDDVISGVQRAINMLDERWPLDNCTSDWVHETRDGEWIDTSDDDAVVEAAETYGHGRECLTSEDASFAPASLGQVPATWVYQCRWDHTKRAMTCGAIPYISTVFDSFAEALPWEQHVFEQPALDHWNLLQRRNARVFHHLQEVEEDLTHPIERISSWLYSYLRHWSPWQQSSQVPEPLLK